MHYLALLFGPEAAPEPEPGTPEFEAEVARYAAFEESVGSAIAGGVALHPADQTVTIRQTDDGPLITDGPYVESTEVVGGTIVFEADNLDTALELTRRVPAAEDGYVEVWPMVEFTEAEGPMADWWLALMLEPAGVAVAPGTPEWEAGAAEHLRFAEKVGDVLRGGGALHPPTSATTVRVRDGEVLLTDGPFAESGEVANGFYYLAAPDRETAAAIAAQIPLGPGGRVELRQIADLSEGGDDDGPGE